MEDQIAELVEEAERFVAAGHFDTAAERIERVAPEIAELDRPDLLARAAWVAATCALARRESQDFTQMAQVAAHAIELASNRAARHEVETLARRVQAVATIGNSGDPDRGVEQVLAAHTRLLIQLADDSESTASWELADADRANWPHMFAAVRAALGHPCAAENLILRAGGDSVASVVVAVLIGLDDVEIDADELAALCFRDERAVKSARRHIRALVDRGILTRRGPSVRLTNSGDD